MPGTGPVGGDRSATLPPDRDPATARPGGAADTGGTASHAHRSHPRHPAKPDKPKPKQPKPQGGKP
jgi:hypothetical protein